MHQVQSSHNITKVPRFISYRMHSTHIPFHSVLCNSESFIPYVQHTHSILFCATVSLKRMLIYKTFGTRLEGMRQLNHHCSYFQVLLKPHPMLKHTLIHFFFLFSSIRYATYAANNLIHISLLEKCAILIMFMFK